MFNPKAKNKLILPNVTPYLTVETLIEKKDYSELADWLDKNFKKQAYPYSGTLYLIDESIASFAFLTSEALSLLVILDNKINSSEEVCTMLYGIGEHLLSTLDSIIGSASSLSPSLVALDISKSSGA